MANFEEQLYCDFGGVAQEGMAGKDILLCVFDKTGAELLAIAGQQGLTINREKETIEVNTKTAGGWKQKVHGIKDWSIDLSGLYSKNHESHKVLEQAFANDDFLCLKVMDMKEKKPLFGGLAILGDFPIEAPFDDAVTYSTTFAGTGPLVNLMETSGTAEQLPDGYEEEPGV